MEHYRAGQEITFTNASEAPTVFNGRVYEPGDQITIKLGQDWTPEEDEDFGAGRPWGWGGFTNDTLRRIALPGRMPWEVLRPIENPDDPEEVLGLEPDPDWL